MRTRRWKLFGVAGAFAGTLALIFSSACAIAAVQLRPETDSTLHVGEVAALRVPSNRQFSIGSAGNALILINQKQSKGETVYLYRAVTVGSQTFVATPKDSGPDGCISCGTVHYFAKIIQ